MRVLVVEDEAVLAAAVARGLRHEAWPSTSATTGPTPGQAGREPLRRGRARPRPCVHGDQVCRTLAGQATPTRILMLTASGTVDDRVEG